MKPSSRTLFRCLFLVFCLVCPRLKAQDTPFANDLVSALNFTETYSEPNATPSSTIHINGSKFSLTNATLDASGQISVSLNGCNFTAYLSQNPDFSDNPDYSTFVGMAEFAGIISGTSFRCPLYDASYNPIPGSITVTFSPATQSSPASVGFAISLTGQYDIVASAYLGGMGWTAADVIGSIPCTISFAGCSQSSRLVYYTGYTSADGAAVTLSGAYDSTAPVAQVVWPAPNSKVYYPIINVGGTVSDLQSGPKMVSVSVNHGPATNIDVSSSESWNLPDDSPAYLNEGKNIISVQSTDMDGNTSGLTDYAVFYTKISPLVVKISGSGSATLSGTTNHFTGENLKLKATPAPGYVFDHWEGQIGAASATSSPTDYFSSSASVTGTMQPFSTLSAVFIPSPFIGFTGNYGGILVSGTLPNADGGAFALNMNAFGGFSGKLHIGGVDCAIKGNFNNAGNFSGTFGTKTPVSVTLHFNSSTKQVTGTAVKGALSAAIQSDLAVFSKAAPLNTGTGTYTFLIPPASAATDPVTPHGTGYGAATINAAGVVSLSGVLGDGTKFKTSSTLSKDKTFPLFVPLYKNKGALSGVIAIEAVDGVSDFDGVLNWFKPVTSGSFYPAQFATQPTMIGSRYDKTLPVNANAAYLSILTSSGSPVLVSSTTSLTSLSTVKLGAAPLPPSSLPNPNKLSLTVAPGTGLFSGSFINGTIKTGFSGAIFQKQSMGAGFFLNKTQSGSVLIQ